MNNSPFAGGVYYFGLGGMIVVSHPQKIRVNFHWFLGREIDVFVLLIYSNGPAKDSYFSLFFCIQCSPGSLCLCWQFWDCG